MLHILENGLIPWSCFYEYTFMATYENLLSPDILAMNISGRYYLLKYSLHTKS